MSDVLTQIISIPVPFNMIILIVFFGVAAGVITTIAAEVRKYFCHRESVELKRELLDRGLSAPEIEQVVRAETPESRRA